ncbi:ABC transporter ATP-binding protein [Gorillibacterium massiliense]|uniref:ABC transporter ATP-binding protein n=1 Tax=Gorillibacterium massiliense TaxID=1280390 RepID=UPI0004BC8D44|nr:ABC transporter ATP-binding protein [Gorillibacterium massiliense]
MAILETRDLAVAYGNTEIVKKLNLAIPEGKVTSIIGPNGCGKSTVLKTMARLMRPSKGSVLLDGKAIHTESTRDVARKLAILPQTPEAPNGLTVQELVTYGRFPYQKGMGRLKPEDRKVIDWAIAETGMDEFRDRPIEALSGGQRQRVWIAMALAQETELLLLDEPTTYLDLAHQLEILQLLTRLNREQNRTVAMVLHDLNLAARFSDYMVAVRAGEVICAGSPQEVLTSSTLKKVFEIDAEIVTDPRNGTPVCLTYDLVGRQLVLK